MAPELSSWLQPLVNCRTLSCIVTNIPTTPPPSWPANLPWTPAGSTGPITTTPEPVTMALLGTGADGYRVGRTAPQAGDGRTGLK